MEKGPAPRRSSKLVDQGLAAQVYPNPAMRVWVLISESRFNHRSQAIGAREGEPVTANAIGIGAGSSEKLFS